MIFVKRLNMDAIQSQVTSLRSIQLADKLLNRSVQLWFLVAFVGLVVFAYYIIVFYGGNGVSGNLEAWGEVSLKGHVEGDVIGNIFFMSHIAMAAIISLGGIVQVIPYIRKHALHVHRWNGRLYLLTAFLISLGGLYLVWVRGSTTTFVGSIAVTINALLILYFGGKTWIAARGHQVQQHRRWALRTFIVASGVWFFRVGFMAWIFINQGPVGSTDNLDGPFDYAWSFLNYLLPLAVLEGYFIISNRSTPVGKYMMSGLIFLLTIITGVGIFGAYLFMWGPNL